MERIARRISTSLYALGIMGALSFGASQAFGRAVQLTCLYDPPTHLGACVNHDAAECLDRCNAYLAPDSAAAAICTQGGPQGCCTCLL